jgi:hypothetical protein
MHTAEAIYGERVIDLLPALVALKDGMTLDRSGRYRISARLDSAVAAPLRRALARAEAELLLEDADRIGTSEEADRTPQQRAADALVRLVTALA